LYSLKLILSNWKYFSAAWVFASLNILIGTWVMYIPHVKSELQLDDGQLGIALFCYAMGTLLLIPFVPMITKKIGVGKSTILGITLFAAAFLLPLLMGSYIALCGSLFVVGAFSGFTDVSMNAMVSEIEMEDEVHVMSATHGFFSLGGVIGAGIGSVLIPIFNNPINHMALIGLIVIVMNVFLMRHYYNIKEKDAKSDQSSYSFNLLRPLFGLAFIAAIVMASEGAIEHWSKLYLMEVVQTSLESTAALGYILFSIAMTVGRFFADGISMKLGSRKIIILGIGLSLVGYILILTTSFYPVIFGFSLVGLGLSVVIPELFRVAGKVKNLSSSAGISFVSGIGFAGFLLGPVIMGFISKSSNLQMSYVAFTLFCSIALTVAVFMKPAKD